MEDIRRFSIDMKSVLVELNIADDYFKAKDRIEKLERELERKEKELYDLRNDLIAEQMKAETNEETARGLEIQNKELMLQKVKLETALEEALLDKDTKKSGKK